MSRTLPNKRRRLGPSEDGARSSLKPDQWNLEQAYERPRKLKKVKENTRLPVKTADGGISHMVVPKVEDNELESSFGSLDDDTPPTEEDAEEPAEPEGPKLSPREEILQAKEELARIAALINEDPEEHSAALRTLGQITASKNFTVTKLGLATQLSVYKDIIPGYRIRPLSEEDGATRLSKDVRKLRNFEQSIVVGYQKYVKELGRIAGLHTESTSSEASGLVTVAFTCVSNLLESVPHFNFRSELLKIIVTKLSTKKMDKNTVICRDAMETLFRSDEDGNASLEAVALLAKMIKAKNYNVDEGALNTFLSLRLLSEFGQKGSNKGIDKAEPDANKTLKKPKQKREFRTKNMRKQMKESKAIEKELQEADAVVSHEQRDQIQAETLKLVFGVYFRVLKVRTPALMGAVLEGLVKYAHLINQEFFGDLLEALKDLINEAELPEGDEDQEVEEDVQEVSRNVTRESLLCVITAFALLQGQDAAGAASTLHLDLNFFISHLYRTLYPCSLDADLELSARSLHLADPSDSSFKPTTKVNVSTTVVLLLRSLTAVLLPSNARSVPPVRLAAFTKQIMTSSLHLPEKSSTAVLGLLGQVARQHKRRINALWNTEERRGDGVFNATKGEVEGSNPFSTTIWEGELLRLHWVPEVRAGIKMLEDLVVDKP